MYNNLSLNMIFLLLTIFSVELHACVPISSERLIGIWRAVSVSNNDSSVSANNSQMEVKFSKHGYIQFRVIDTTIFDSNEVSEFEGYYNINKSILKITFIYDIWDESQISYCDDTLELTSLSGSSEFTTVFERIDDWSIKSMSERKNK